METQELVTLAPWTIIFQIVNLFIQMVLIKKFLFKPINNIIAKRKEMAEAELTEARKAKEEADAAKEEYSKALSEAKQKAETIISEATVSAQVKNEAIIKEAEQEALRIRNRAEADIELERKKALNDLKNEIGGLAVDIAGKVVEREISEEDNRRIIEEFLEQVGDAV